MQIKQIVVLSLICFTAVLTGCSNWPTRHLHSNLVKVSFEVIAKSADERPRWINQLPEAEQDSQFLVGLSNFHSSERDARQDAMRHARLEFAQYTGVDVNDIDKVIQALYGSSSHVLDATHSEISGTQQSVEAHVSRIKAKQWYWEKYKTQKNDEGQIAYKYWVLVTVPANEYERVQAWKEKRTANIENERQRIIQHAKTQYNKLADLHKKKLAEIDEFLKEGKLVIALRATKTEWNYLYQKYQDFEKLGEYYQQFLPDIKQAQENTLTQIAKIRNSIIIDKGLNKVRYLSDAKSVIPVWLWVDVGASTKPLSDFPLYLRNQNGEILARGKSDHTGKVQLSANNFIPGTYYINVDTSAAELQNLDLVLRNSLSSVVSTIILEYPTNPKERAIKLAMQKLFDQTSMAKNSMKRIIFENIANSKNEETSALDKDISDYINLALQNIKYFVNTPDNVKKSTKKDKTIYLQADSRSPNVIKLELMDGNKNQIVAKSEAIFHSQVAQSNNSIDIDITSHLGDNQTYMEGDNVSYYVSFNKDAYLLIIYQDASGNLIQIFPSVNTNRHPLAASDFLEIPGKFTDFDLKVSKPFGKETVWAIASTQKFPNLKGESLTNGLVLLSEKSMQKLLNQLHENINKSDSLFGFANTTITTVARSQ